jgi:xanthine dehydrogenase accessory factor
MREIAKQVGVWLERGAATALATLVHVQNSAPRLPGAHCAVTGDGELAGAISAGCVESDLFERAQAVLADGVTRIASYTVADADAMRIGLTCGGAIDVLIEPIDKHRAAWAAVLAAVAHNRPVGLAAVVTPGDMLGRRMFLVGDATGSIDAALDAEIAAAMRDQLVAGGSRNLEFDRGGAAVRVFIEAIAPPPHLIVVGATQTALPLCRMAKELDFRVTVVDPRAVYASEERLGGADAVIREWPDQAFARLDLDDNCYLAILTHDAKFDLPSLRAVLRSPVRYIGALGSRRTHAKRVEALRAEGYGDAEIARIHSPIGMDLGGRAPAEIALSILAEITAVRFGRDPRARTEVGAPGAGVGS